MWNKLKQWLHPDHITRSSIKEGFDDLPAAVCYFTPDGIIRLCNRQMFRVYRALSGRDLQSLEELHQQVWAPTHGRRVDGKNPSFVLPDGTCWLYSEQTVFGEGVRPHVECIFSEVTDLQRQRQELLRQNQELLRMNRELRRLSENVQEMTREKEILEFKTRLHDEMGYGLTAVRQCLLQRKDPAELEASLEQMNKAVQLYRKDSEAPPEENEWDVFVEDAAQLGVTVALQGPMPRQRQQLLLTIARECITNAVRYAGANRLEITITPQGGGQRWQFENDGPPPADPAITPGGGLTAIQRRVMQAGGTMEVQARPRYRLLQPHPPSHCRYQEKLHPPPSGGVRFCRAKPLSHGLRKDGRVVQRRSLPVRQTPLQRGAFFMLILLPKVPNCGTRRKYWKNFGQNTEKFSQFCPLWPMRNRGAVWYP